MQMVGVADVTLPKSLERLPHVTPRLSKTDLPRGGAYWMEDILSTKGEVCNTSTKVSERTDSIECFSYSRAFGGLTCSS
jgi:hypothetical protein